MFDLKSPTKMFYAHTTSEYVSEYVHIYIYTYTLPGTKIWDDTGNKNYNLCSRIPLLPYSSGPVVLWSCGQAPQDFASFPVENLLIYQPSTATFLQAASLDPLHNNMVNPDLVLESEGDVLAISGSGHEISHVKLVSAGSQQQNDLVRDRDVHLVHVPSPSQPSILWRRSCCLTTYPFVDVVKEPPTDYSVMCTDPIEEGRATPSHCSSITGPSDVVCYNQEVYRVLSKGATITQLIASQKL